MLWHADGLQRSDRVLLLEVRGSGLMFAAMRVSMPMAEFVAWLAGSGLVGLLAGLLLRRR